MKFRKIAILTAVIFLTIGCVYSEEKVVADKIPDDYVFIDAAIAEHFHPFKRSLVCWPDTRQIADSRTKINKDAAEEAIDSTMEWLSKMLRTEWVPEQSTIDFYPMSTYIQKKCDAVYFRYRIKNYGFQVVSTYWSMNVIIKDLGSSHLPDNLEVDMAKQYVSTTLDKFMQKSDQIKKTSMAKVTKTSNGVKGTFDTRLDCWYNLMGWWTDGNTVMLSTTKVDEGPYIPGGKDVWFSDAPVPGSVQLLKKIESLDDLLPDVVRKLITWPSPDELKRMQVLDRNVLGVKAAWAACEDWIKNVLSPKWQPPQNAIQLIIGNEAKRYNETKRYDTVRLRWENNGYDVQLTQTATVFILKLIQFNSKPFGNSAEEQSANISKLAASIFSSSYFVRNNAGDKVPLNIMNLLENNFKSKDVKFILKDNNKVIYHLAQTVELTVASKDNEHAYGTARHLAWYEMINWFNDKNTVCFYFLKNEGGCPPAGMGFEDRLNSTFFEFPAPLAITIACEKADKLNLEYDKKTIKANHKKGPWNIIFNPGENTETTVVVDAVTGSVIDVVKKNSVQAKD